MLVHGEDKEESFRQFFLVFDRELSGSVKKKTLRMIFSNLGETFSPEEWSAFERVFDLANKSDSDLIPYEPIIDRYVLVPFLFSSSHAPLLYIHPAPTQRSRHGDRCAFFCGWVGGGGRGVRTPGEWRDCGRCRRPPT